MATSCSLDAAFRAAAVDLGAQIAASQSEMLESISASRLEIRVLATRIEGVERAIRALDAVRLALEAKTWMAYQHRRTGRVKAGCARAATARRDSGGRFLCGTCH